MLVDEGRKAKALFDFFNGILGTSIQRQRVLHLDLLGLSQLNVFEPSSRFTEEEVLAIILSLSLDKALGPDGFTACFLQVAWDMIKADIMLASDAF
jgi:hypothetical protein